MKALSSWLWKAGLVWLAFPAMQVAWPAEDTKVTVQAVQASDQGKNTDKPEIDPSLSAFQNLLKGQGFGKYKDIGKDSGGGAAIKLNAGGYTIDVTVIKSGKQGTTIKYVIRKGGAAIGQDTVTLQPGEATSVQVGNPKSPVILVIKLDG